MPLIPQTMAGFMSAKGANLIMGGSKFAPFVFASSSGTSQYLMLASTVNTTNVVIGPGAGTFTGKIVGAIPSGMSILMMAKAATMLVVGKDTKKLFDAVSFGVVQALNAVIPMGSVVGGGPGSGVGKIIGLSPLALEPLILAQLAIRIMVGEKTRQLVKAISFGICTHLMTVATVTTTCVGAFTPPPVGPVTIPAAPGLGRFA